jgi:hypothetical protein
MRLRTLLLALVLLAVAAPAAGAFRLPDVFGPIAGNPADRLAAVPADAVEYDRARRCDPRARPGVVLFGRWLSENVRGAYWGSYRCERWGRGSASLHAENRAIDWHLDVSDPQDRAAARRVIRVLLAPDRAGTPQALARRMGVQEIIWDCSYWGAGMAQFSRYSPCYGRDGTPRRRVDRTTAHRDHIHFGMSRAGAAAQTTFWRAR